MSRKVFAQVSVFVLLVLAFFGTPLGAQAGGVCGGAYIVEAGETPETIAAKCGASAAAIYAANPGIGTLYAGQVLTVPGNNYIVPSAPIPNTVSATISNTNNYNTYNYYNYPAAGTNGNYVVQVGDTFSGIASRYGVGVYDLWTANPNIVDINFLYAGQTIRVPASVGAVIVPTSTYTPTALSYGTVPFGTPTGKVSLSRKTRADVYVSLQGATRDGINIIREYPVNDSMTVKVPAGWYTYVAWVGGLKFEGQFSLSIDGGRAILFYDKKVVVE